MLRKSGDEIAQTENEDTTTLPQDTAEPIKAVNENEFPTVNPVIEEPKATTTENLVNTLETEPTSVTGNVVIEEAETIDLTTRLKPEVFEAFQVENNVNAGLELLNEDNRKDEEEERVKKEQTLEAKKLKMAEHAKSREIRQAENQKRAEEKEAEFQRLQKENEEYKQKVIILELINEQNITKTEEADKKNEILTNEISIRIEELEEHKKELNKLSLKYNNLNLLCQSQAEQINNFNSTITEQPTIQSTSSNITEEPKIQSTSSNISSNLFKPQDLTPIANILFHFINAYLNKKRGCGLITSTGEATAETFKTKLNIAFGLRPVKPFKTIDEIQDFVKSVIQKHKKDLTGNFDPESLKTYLVAYYIYLGELKVNNQLKINDIDGYMQSYTGNKTPEEIERDFNKLLLTQPKMGIRNTGKK